MRQVLILFVLFIIILVLGIKWFSNEYLDPRSPTVPIRLKPYPWED